MLKLTLYVKPETQTILRLGQMIFQFVLSSLNYSEKVFFPLHLKGAPTGVTQLHMPVNCRLWRNETTL